MYNAVGPFLAAMMLTASAGHDAHGERFAVDATGRIVPPTPVNAHASSTPTVSKGDGGRLDLTLRPSR